MIKIHIKRGGMWRKVYFADRWTLAAHGLLVATVVFVGIQAWR